MKKKMQWVAVVAMGLLSAHAIAVDLPASPEPVKYSTVFDLIDPATGNVGKTLLLETIFDGDRAYGMNAGGMAAWYDLANQTMTQGDHLTYTLDAAKKRADEITQRLLADVPNMKDAQLAATLSMEAQPHLNVTESGGEIVITNGATVYHIAPAPLPQALRQNFYLVSRLSDYTRADAMHPPNAMLAVTAELEKRGVYAKELTLSMNGKTTVKIHASIGALSAEDQRNLAAVKKYVDATIAR